MFERILVVVLRQRLATVLLALIVAGAGIWAFSTLEIEAYPDMSDTQVVVITQSPGHAAEEMEQQITIPIERALNNTPRVIARRSRTIFGLSVVELTFDYDTDDYFARQVVGEKLRDAELPEGITPQLGPMTTPTGELYRYRMDGAGHDEMELRELQDWVVIPRLLQEPGIADVSNFGGLVKQYQVEVNPNALEKYNVTIGQISRAISANNQNAGGALVDNGQQALVVRGVGLIRSVADIENIVLSAAKGAPVFVRDIGRVHIGPAVQTGIFGIDGRSGGVEGLVLMRRGENPSDVLQGIREAVDDLNSARLPAGVRVTPIYDRTELVHNTLRTVARTLVEALLIVFVVLLFFLGSFRAAVLTAVTIPLSLLFAFVCMKLYGIPASLLSLGALDFGIIVEATLVMVEYIVRCLDLDEGGAPCGSAYEAIRKAALAVDRPILFSMSILVCAYIPIFTLQRVERRLFSPMAFTICAALAGSLLLTMTLVPVLATWLFGRGEKTWRNPLIEWALRRHRRELGPTLEHPWLVVGVSLAIVAGALGLGKVVGSEFLPQLDEGVIWIRANLPPGISLNRSAATASEIRGLLRQSPEVKTVTSQSGRVDDGTDPFGPNRNEFLVMLHPYDTWPSGKRKQDLVNEMSARLNGAIPGADFNFTQPIIDMVTESVTGSSADLAVILTGSDRSALRGLGDQTLAVLRSVRGAADTAIEQEADQPQLRIELDRQALARYAINEADVQELIELAVGGKAVSSKFEGERRFDITLRYVPEARVDANALGNILVHSPDGARVPLAQLARIAVVDGASIIARRENNRQLTVRTNIRGRDQGSYVAEAQRKFRSAVHLPNGYGVTWGGQFENLERARHRLYIVIPITLGIILALLYWTFGAAKPALLVLMNVPYSMVGGIIALYLRGISFSVSAAVGFLSLFGVAVMSGVLFITEVQRRGEHCGKQGIIDASVATLRPRLILITVAAIGILPAALATGIGSDIQRPMATVIFGGLLSTLIITPFELPAAYYLAVRREKRAAHES